MSASHLIVDPSHFQAAVVRPTGHPLRLEPLRLGNLRPGEILVKIVASGICHTDIDFCTGAPGSILGHEGAGIVERVGSAVKKLRRGDHVVLSYQSCGRCPECRKGHPAGCREFWKLNFEFCRLDGTSAYGEQQGHFFGQSSFATHSVATERNAVKVSKSLPLPVLAPLGCGLQTGAGTVLHSLHVKPGQSLIVLGAGTVGLAAVMAGKMAQAGPIIAVDIRPKRLKLARELGASHALDSRHIASLRAALQTIAPHGLDAAVDTAGDSELASAVLDQLKDTGSMAFLTGSVYASAPGRQRLLSVIQGDSVPQEFIPQLIRWWRAGRFPFDRLITFYDFKDINRAIADSEKGRCIKPVLKIG